MTNQKDLPSAVQFEGFTVFNNGKPIVLKAMPGHQLFVDGTKQYTVDAYTCSRRTRDPVWRKRVRDHEVKVTFSVSVAIDIDKGSIIVESIGPLKLEVIRKSRGHSNVVKNPKKIKSLLGDGKDILFGLRILSDNFS